MNYEFKSLMEKSLAQMSMELTDRQIEQFEQYYEMLVEWNKVMNLTTITEMQDVVVKHFVDSLSLVQMVKDFGNEVSVIDVGTGAGFPGIPLKIVFPDIKITLLDSLNKRINFLNEVVTALQLKDVRTIHGRAEDFGRNPDYRERYDFCVSRAVANLSTLSEYCLPFVKVKGSFISYKSGKVEGELEQAKGAIFKLGSRIANTCEFVLPGGEAGRVLVRIEKTQIMSKKYPRKAGLPAKEPLV